MAPCPLSQSSLTDNTPRTGFVKSHNDRPYGDDKEAVDTLRYRRGGTKRGSYLPAETVEMMPRVHDPRQSAPE